MAEINNTFAYPNVESYASMGRGTAVGNSVSHGWIGSISTEQVSFVTGGNMSGTPNVHKANQTFIKNFQFNPVSTAFELTMVDRAPADSDTPGGADPTAAGGVGAATTSLSLMYNREIEVWRATNGNSNTPEYFREIGVQKDVLDIYRVILGSDTPTAIDTDQSTEAMMGELFDSAVAGRSINHRPVIVSFNKALTYYGLIQGMTFEYQKFNRSMVPTLATINLVITILNISARTAVTSTATTSANTPGGASAPAAPSSTTGSSSTTVPNTGFGGPLRRPIGAQSVMW